MTPLPKRTFEWMLKVKSSYNFLTKARDQNDSRAKIFLFILVKFKKLRFSAPLRLVWLKLRAVKCVLAIGLALIGLLNRSILVDSSKKCKFILKYRSKA